MAALYDFALLATMYVTFGGFFNGAAMMASAGVSAGDFAKRAASWLGAMLRSLPYQAAQIDSGDYTTIVQSLDFNKKAVDEIVRAGPDAGIDTAIVEPLRALVDRQVAAGNGKQAFSRVYESIAAR
jgi:hypothetical protein